MTEQHESDFLVTVRAQVMIRDESTEGWVPLSGGGIANVSIRKRAKLSPDSTGHEYIIYGERILDQSVILSCAINRELKYYKVMPTFHHWKSGKQRNGLTFNTAADARAFDKGVLRAYNELIDGLAKSNPSIICPPLNKYDSVGEDDVFMTLDLPIESDCLQITHSSPEGSFGLRGLELYKDTNSNKSDSERPTSATIHYISGEKTCLPNLQQLQQTQQQQFISTVSGLEPPPTIAPSENYSYVTLTAVHDYNYAVADQPLAAQVLNARRESVSALKKRNALEAGVQGYDDSNQIQTNSPISAVILKDSNLENLKGSANTNRHRCRYCHELYNEEWNRRGACEFAPDRFRSGLECISGMGCARCMLYHCMKDAEGETPQHPCECRSETGCTKRWIGLTLLSLIVPCLWCYPPLRACHLLGVSCGVCGGKHKPQV